MTTKNYVKRHVIKTIHSCYQRNVANYLISYARANHSHCNHLEIRHVICTYLVAVVWFLLLLQQRILQEAQAAPALSCIPPQPRDVLTPSNDDVDVVTDLNIGLPGTERSSKRDSGWTSWLLHVATGNISWRVYIVTSQDKNKLSQRCVLYVMQSCIQQTAATSSRKWQKQTYNPTWNSDPLVSLVSPHIGGVWLCR
jgi:hypothetical protein